MNIYIRSLGICVSSLFFLLQTPALSAQEPAAPKSAATTTAAAAEPQSEGQIVSSPSQVVPALPVPRLIKFSGVAKDASGQRRSGVVGITFSIYADQQGGTTLWMETQNAALDAQGRYAVLLGSTQSAGLPLDLFATGEPRWLGAKLELAGEVEQPRVLLVSVPYALKASDADTVGGMPASAFVLAPTGAGANASAPGSAKSTAAKSKAEPLFTSSGTTNYIPIFTDSTGDIGNSVIYQNGGKVGIGFSGTMTANLVVGASAGGAVLNASNLVDQDMFVTVSAPGATDKHTFFGPSTNTNLTLGVGGVEKVRINSAGNVGIGFSNPQQRLVIGAPAGGTVLNATNLADQDLQVNVSAPGSSDKHTFFGPSAATNLTLGVGGLEMMRITNSGNVGIGTNAPAAKLAVNGNVMLNGGELEPPGTVYYGIRWLDGSGNIQAHLHRFGAVDNNLYVTNDGRFDLTGVYLASGATSWTSTSDERLKTDIVPVTGILDKIKKIRVVAFDMASLSVDGSTGKPTVNRDVPPRRMKDGTVIRQQIGSIAQDWVADFSQLVVEPQTDDQYYGLNYDRIGVVALGGVKELTALVEAKDAEIKALSVRLAALEQALRQLTQQSEPVR